MSHFLIALGAVIAVIAVGTPIAAALLVSVASRREESRHTLSGQAPGAVTRAARRLLAFRTQTGQPPTWTQDPDLAIRRRPPAARHSATRTGAWHSRSATEPVAFRLLADASQHRRESADTRAA